MFRINQFDSRHMNTGGQPGMPLNLACRLALLFYLSLILPTIAPAATNSPPAYDARVSVAFGSQCRTLLVNAINEAKADVTVAIFSLTDKTIYTAMIAASKRGVSVRIKYDKESAEFPTMKAAIGELKKAGIYCRAINMKDDAKMHHKFAVVDGRVVLTGSYNFTSMATFENMENLVRIESAPLATRYLAEFKKIH